MTDKDVFLWMTLEEMDGWDGCLEAEEVYRFLVNRDGQSRYSVQELDTWLEEDEDEDEQQPGGDAA